MPKEWFSVGNSTSLKTLPGGARIHVIGVSGVAMAQLAILLADRGFEVSGSDKDFYEPMGTLLRKSKVKILQGYRSENVPIDSALVIIGNVVSYGHPEVEVVERLCLPYSFFPKALSEAVIADKHSIVVSGTHGKTTTSAMIAHALTALNLDPSFFIGGTARNLESSLKCGKGEFSVVEGDEYDSSFFAKVPKFCFYGPKSLLVTSVEFDHADIYNSLEEIEAQFTKMVRAMPADGLVLACSDDANVQRLAKEWESLAKCPIVKYGEDVSADYVLSDIKLGARAQAIVSCRRSKEKFTLNLQVPGVHNLRNACGAVALAHRRQLDLPSWISALGSFAGVARRQDLRFDQTVTLIDDFAHHPTAVAETIAAIKKKYANRRLWAVFEPRSNTSRKKVFQSSYIQAFRLAEMVVLCEPKAREADERDLINVADLVNEISKTGPKSWKFPDAAAIKNHLLDNITSGDVILVMSNGSFSGLVDELVLELDKRYKANYSDRRKL